jgi:hypothetical protein
MKLIIIINKKQKRVEKSPDTNRATALYHWTAQQSNKDNDRP